MKKLERKLKTSRETSQKLIQGKKAKMKRQEKINKEENGITLIALVITIVLNSSYLAMERMNKIEKI